MWRGLTQLPSMLAELIALHREANSLQRELIALLSGRSAVTAPTPANVHPLVSAARASQLPPQKRRLYTAKDIVFHTREDDLALQEMRQQAQNPLNPPLDENSRPISPVPRSPLTVRDPADEGDELMHP